MFLFIYLTTSTTFDLNQRSLLGRLERYLEANSVSLEGPTRRQ